MDVLTDVLQVLRLTSRVYCRSKLRAPWGLNMPPSRRMAFHVVGNGGAWLRAEGIETLTALAAGDRDHVADVGQGLGRWWRLLRRGVGLHLRRQGSAPAHPNRARRLRRFVGSGAAGGHHHLRPLDTGQAAERHFRAFGDGRVDVGVRGGDLQHEAGAAGAEHQSLNQASVDQSFA